MINKLEQFIYKVFGFERREREIQKIHDKTELEVERIYTNASARISQATLVLKENGKMRKILIQKTTTYYMGRAMGVIR